jgi:hypothetical protein
VWTLPVYVVLLGISTLTHQPDHTTDFEAYARYVTADSFLVSHLAASIGGAVIGIAGIACLAPVLIQSGASARRTLTAAVLSIAGNVVNTALFGVVALDNDVYGPELPSTALIGLTAFMTGAVLLGSATAAASRWLRWSGIT